MAALLVAMGVMAVMMTAAMPVWKHAAQREKEAELVFRGEQYAHAIALFQRKFANAVAPSIDVLVEQRFLRKKYKDPMTNDDFMPLTLGQAAAAGLPGAASGTSPQRAGQGQTRPGPATPQPASIAAPTPGSMPGIIGVVSKSKGKSLRTYNGRNHYNEWAFVYLVPSQAPRAGVPGSAIPGQPGQRGGLGVPGPRGQPAGTDPSGGRGRGAPGRGGPGGRGRAGGP